MLKMRSKVYNFTIDKSRKRNFTEDPWIATLKNARSVVISIRMKNQNRGYTYSFPFDSWCIKLGGIDLSVIIDLFVTTKIESFTSPGYKFSKQTPGSAKFETTRCGYTKSGNLVLIFSSDAGHPFRSSISYAPKISYGPTAYTGRATLTSQSKIDSFTLEPLFPKALALGPTPAIYASTVSKGYLPTKQLSI